MELPQMLAERLQEGSRLRQAELYEAGTRPQTGIRQAGTASPLSRCPVGLQGSHRSGVRSARDFSGSQLHVDYDVRLPRCLGIKGRSYSAPIRHCQ